MQKSKQPYVTIYKGYKRGVIRKHQRLERAVT